MFRDFIHAMQRNVRHGDPKLGRGLNGDVVDTDAMSWLGSRPSGVAPATADSRRPLAQKT